MKTILNILLLFSLQFSALNLNAQKHELGKVTIDELKQKSDPNDSSAVATVLFEIGETRAEFNGDEFDIVTETKVKIKIYKKEGFSYANQKVNYYSGTYAKFSDACTYNLVNNKIEKTKLSKDGEFQEEINKNWSQRKIALPNVKEGSIIEYSLELRNNTSFEYEWSFQREIPVNYSEYIAFIPEYFTYKTRNKGFILPKTTTEKKNKTFIIRGKVSSDSNFTTASTTFTQSELTFLETKAKYILENVPALKDEIYVDNIDNYAAKIALEISSIEVPGRYYKDYSITWDNVAKTIYESDDFGLELNKTTYFENDIKALLKEVPNNDEKIYVIYNYVQQQMNWNKSNGVFCNEGVKNAYQNKTGDAAEINLMLTSMLRYAGFNANPVLVSTRSNGIASFPSIRAFNYVVAAVESNGQVILLDATNKNALPNILPLNDLNGSGRLIRKDGTSVNVDLTPNSNSVESVILIGAIDSEAKLTGKIRDQYYNYNAFTFRDKYNGVAKESYLESLEKKCSGITIEEYEVLNSMDLLKPITENYSFSDSNAVEIIGDKMYFSPLVFFAQTKNPFTQETRQYPIDFDFPNQKKYNITIQYPEGYEVESMPKPATIAMHKDLGSFNYMISNVSNKCQFSFSVNINRAIISADDYEIVQAFFKELIEKENEKIVLVKK